jgi:hypothetical protein
LPDHGGKNKEKRKMKKLLIAAAIVCAAVVSQAAAFAWDGFDINDIEGNAFTGAATLYCVELPAITATGVITDGELVGNNIVSDDFVVGTTYNFYFTAADTAGNTYKSEILSSPAWAVGTASFSFEGNGTWTAAPEPTSGLLLLLGVAGLALKRKRA